MDLSAGLGEHWLERQGREERLQGNMTPCFGVQMVVG